MPGSLRSLLSPPTVAREEFATPRTLQIILVVTLAGLGLAFATARDFPDKPLLGIAVASTVISLVCNHLGSQTWAIRITMCSMLFVASALAYVANDGFRSIAISLLPGLLVVAALLVDPRWYLVLTALTVGIVTSIGLREMEVVAHGHVITRSVTRYSTIAQFDCILTVVAVAAGLLARNLRASLRRTRQTIAQLDKANKELQESERRFRSLVELAVDAIFITDHAGQILDVNQRACSLTGYTKNRLLGLSMTEVFAPGQDGDPRPAEPHTTQTEVLCADGSRVTVELNSKTMPDGVVQIFCRDTTERRRTEEQIRQMQKMESIGRLAGGVAHDFNNLLTVIGGYTHMLMAHTDSNDRIREPVRQIHAAVEHAAGLTQQLLTFGRKHVSHPQPVEVAELVESSRTMLQRLLGEDVEVVVLRDPSAAVTMADPVQLHQVLVNLAINGRDAMPDGGTLTIATGTARFGEGSFDTAGEIAPGEYVRLAVSDTGAGMTEEVQKNIFEPFFTTKEVGKGTGLGLATVHGIVHQYKGFIDVRSAPGQGSTFTVYLPLSEASARTIESVDPVQPRQGSETLLVVEDQDAVRQLTTAVLRANGYLVLDAANGEVALKLTQATGSRIDLILTDVVMPRMNGNELVERLLVLQPHAKVIYVSGYSGDIIAPWNLPAGRINLLSKPFSVWALARMVREVLDGETQA